MSNEVRLRNIEPNDLPIFYEQQLYADATRMAAFPARDRAAFDAHWATRILGNPSHPARAVPRSRRPSGASSGRFSRYRSVDSSTLSFPAKPDGRHWISAGTEADPSRSSEPNQPAGNLSRAFLWCETGWLWSVLASGPPSSARGLERWKWCRILCACARLSRERGSECSSWAAGRDAVEFRPYPWNQLRFSRTSAVIIP